mgnify:CR=1 FL=1
MAKSCKICGAPVIGQHPSSKHCSIDCQIENRYKTIRRRSRMNGKTGIRFAVFERDGFRFTYCGASPSGGATLHVDHVVAIASGGSDEMSNLATACSACNQGKKDRQVDRNAHVFARCGYESSAAGFTGDGVKLA